MSTEPIQHVTSEADAERVADFDEALARAFAKVARAKADGLDTQLKKDGKARRYVTLASVDQACREALTSEGFSYPQLPETRQLEGGGLWLTITTQLRRKGVALVGTFGLPVLGQRKAAKDGGGYHEPTAQSVGSALTYGRRYALTSLVGVCPDDDDDGHAASQHEEPKADPLWDAYVEARDAVASQLGCSVDRAHERCCAEAQVRYQGEPNDQQLQAMTAAARRLLEQPREPRVPANREPDTASGEQVVSAEDQALGQWKAEARGYCEARESDYLDAECRSPSATTKKSFVDAAMRISAEAIGEERWPKSPTVAQLLAATAALKAARAKKASEPEPAPRSRWLAARACFIDARVIDYRKHEGEEPDAQTLDGFQQDMLAISAKAVGIAKWPRSPKDTQYQDAEQALLAEVAKLGGAG